MKNALRKRPPWSLLAVLVLVGFLLVVTGTATSVASENEAPRKEAIIEQILERRQDVDDRDQAVAELRRQVAEAQGDAGRVSQEQQVRTRYERDLSAMAGTTEVEGRGITVKLSDAPRAPGFDATQFGSDRIQDKDIQLLVNALFATGAEAISVNGNRVVSVTPIRAAGGTIVVNYRPVSSPYEISAIGVDKDRFGSSDIAKQLEQWEEKFDLGFEIKERRKMKIPAYAGRTSIDAARAELPQSPRPTP